MKFLITGGFGFAGSHLANHLCNCGDDVVVSFLPKKSENFPAINIPKKVQSIALDVTDVDAVDEVINLLKPDVICHLAALTFVPLAEKNPDKAFKVNTFGTINILNSVLKHSKSTKVLVVTSSEVYGIPRPGRLQVTEQFELKPTSNYGLTKACADLAAYKYFYKNGVQAVVARPFTHVGPGQSDLFALSSFAKQIASIKLGMGKPEIKVGNLEVKRDISDVVDIVRGYREAAINGRPGEAYNLCFGESYEIGELLNKLIEISQIDVKIVVDESRIRSTDIPEIRGSYEKATKHFGWKPLTNIERILHGLFAWWIEKLSANNP